MRCWVLPGNRNDASLVEQIQRDVAGWKLSRVVWVMDRGMTGESQRLALQRGGSHAMERDFLGFSERKPHFFRRWDFSEVHPHVHLLRDGAGPFVPD